MIEVPNPHQRILKLYALGHVEDCIKLTIASKQNNSVKFEIVGKALGSDKTTAEGKTSAVHFITFELTPEQIALLKNNQKEACSASLAITHSNYKHETPLTSETIDAIASDLVLPAGY